MIVWLFVTVSLAKKVLYRCPETYSYCSSTVTLSHLAGSTRHCESDSHSGVSQWQRLTLSHVMSWPA